MNFEPEKFFIGVIDFFAILLPGAIATYFLANSEIGPELLNFDGPAELRDALPGPQGWIAFLFSSYLLGHFIFLTGRWLDRPYDAWRKKKKPKPIFWWLIYNEESSRAYARAKELMNLKVTKVAGEYPINVFQWAKVQIALRKPGALPMVQQFEASSKFFRNLVIVLALLTVAVLSGDQRWKLVFLVVPILFSLWRYAEQRNKATDQACWLVIALEEDWSMTKGKQVQSNPVQDEA